MGEYQAIIDRLKEPFPEDAVLWRIQQSGGNGGRQWALVLAYIDSRAVQDRLDSVVGPENWRVSYNPITIGTDGGFIAALAIRLGTEWIEKHDGAGVTDVEAIKGGISDAFKRAAVTWGIGRYLYDLPATFAEIVQKNNCQNPSKHRFKIQGGSEFYYWNPPAIPRSFLPAGSGGGQSRQRNDNGGNGGQQDPKRMNALRAMEEMLLDMVYGVAEELPLLLKDIAGITDLAKITDAQIPTIGKRIRERHTRWQDEKDAQPAAAAVLVGGEPGDDLPF